MLVGSGSTGRGGQCTSSVLGGSGSTGGGGGGQCTSSVLVGSGSTGRGAVY